MKGKGKNPQLNHCRNSKFNVARTRVGEVGDMLSGTKDMAHTSVQADGGVTATANDYETSRDDQKADGQNSLLETDTTENRATATPRSIVFLMSQRFTCSRLLSSSSLLLY